MFKTGILFFTGITLIALQSCSGKKEEKSTANDTTVEVTVTSPSQQLNNAINASGQLEANQTAAISTRVMGRITSLTVKVGDHVNKGQVLATISDEDFKAKRAQTQAMIAEAEAAMNAAQKDVDRFTALYKQQSATAKELDNVTLQYNSVKAKMEAAKQMRNEVNAMMAYTTLTAPFSGIITQKNAETGSIANPGMPLLMIEQSGNLQVSVAIAENDINKVKLGEAATVNIKSTNKNFIAKVSQINPSSQFSGGQYIIKLSIPENAKQGLYAGMYVNVNIETKDKITVQTDAVLVPVSSIIHKDELTGIYTVSTSNTALLRWVQLGKIYGDKVEVLSGLNKNETFIATANGKLFNGVKVTVK